MYNDLIIIDGSFCITDSGNAANGLFSGVEGLDSSFVCITINGDTYIFLYHICHFISGILREALQCSFVFKILQRRNHILGSYLDCSVHLALLIIRIGLLTAARGQTKDAGNHTY